MLKKKLILIIGGNGFLGKAILNQFNLKKYSISILDPSLNKKSLENNKVKHFFKCSTLDKKAMTKALKTEEWDCIIHLAAYGGNGEGLLKAANEDFNQAVNTNVTGFANLLDNLKYKKTRVIWASSTVVFGEENDYSEKMIKEDANLKPTTNYGLTKLIAEQVANYYIQNYKMNITGIRYPIVIGPGLNYRGVAAGISDMALAIMQKHTKLLVEMPSTPLDIIYIKDAADIIIKMIKTKSKLKNIYNCPSLRTSALKLANEFKNHNENNNLEVKINGIGATYPIMNWQRLKKDINFKINYSVKQLVKDWL